MARSGVVSSTSTTARSVENEWRSSALAGMTSTPEGKRARISSSAPARSAVELVPGHQLLDAVLDGAQADVEHEDLVLEIDLREHPPRVPAELAALVLGDAVLREEPRD